MGDDGWRYQPKSDDAIGAVAGKEEKAPTGGRVGRDKPGAKESELQQKGGEAVVAELKKVISKLAGREAR